MKFRYALLALTVALTAIPVAEGKPPQSPASNNPPLPPIGFLYSSPVNGPMFTGNSCCPSVTDITQGVAGDCFLLSSLAAVAVVSPGTIQKDIQPNPSIPGTYTIRLYRDNALFTSATMPAAGGPLSIYSRTYDTAFPEFTWWLSLKNEQFPWNTNWAFEAPGSKGAVWPMMMEKAYAAFFKDGYNAFMQPLNGGIGYWAMPAITGVNSEWWLLSPHVSTVMKSYLKSVWVHNVPSAGDTAGHSVLGGLLRGDLKAIEPSIEVCVTQAGQRFGTCSPVCKESYTCRTPFAGGGLLLNPSQPSIHVDIVDPSSSLSQRQIASTDKNPANCTEKSPCTINTASGPVVISFDVGEPSSFANEEAHTVTNEGELGGLLDRLQTEGQAVTLSSRPLCSEQPNEPTCATPAAMNGLESAHEFYFIKYDDKANQVIFGDPHDPTQYPVMSLSQMMGAFRAIYSNAVKKTACTCGK
jgi:hypothetical protein